MDDIANSKLPSWLTLVIAAMAVVLTLVGDRLTLADSTSDLRARVTALEQRSGETRQNQAWLQAKIMDLLSKVDANAVVVQRIEDREEELGRRSGIREGR